MKPSLATIFIAGVSFATLVKGQDAPKAASPKGAFPSASIVTGPSTPKQEVFSNSAASNAYLYNNDKEFAMIAFHWKLAHQNPAFQSAYLDMRNAFNAWKNIYKKLYGKESSEKEQTDYFSGLMNDFRGRTINQYMQDVALNAIAQNIRLIEQQADYLTPDEILARIHFTKEFIEMAELDNRDDFMKALNTRGYSAMLMGFEYYTEARKEKRGPEVFQ